MVTEFKKTLKATFKLCSFIFCLFGPYKLMANTNPFPPGGIPLSETVMLDASSEIDELSRQSLESSKAQAAVLSRAYNKLLKAELKKDNPNHDRINRWFMEQASTILNLDDETRRFFKNNLEVVNPSNPFLYRSKEGKNYLAFPALQNGNLMRGSLVRVDEYFNSQMRSTNFTETVKNSANPRHVQFFPREYMRFMAVSYAVTWEMCQVQWSSTKSILSFESLYREKRPGEKKDPLCEEHFIKSLQDPIGWLGFYAFVMANHNLAPRVSNFMFRNLGKVMADNKLPFLNKQIAFFKFFTNIVAGGLGMAAGLTASDYVHQMKENPNLKSCFKYSDQSGWFGEYCQEAYKDFLLINTDARDRMTISTMSLLSAFLLNTASQVPLQMAIQGARAGVNLALSMTLGITLGPAGWVMGAVLYVGSTYLFLRFDHMLSPHIEKWYYSHSKPKAVREAVNELADIVDKQEGINWQTPIAEREEGERCFKDRLYDFIGLERESDCDNPILIDEALRNFSLAMSAHRNMYVLSGTSATISIWQNKWSGFYHNYIGSMGMLDAVSYYRRNLRERLGTVDFLKKYGYDPATRSSVEFFDGIYNPLFGFEDNLVDADQSVYDVDHQYLVNKVHTWIRESMAEVEQRFSRSIGGSISYTQHQKPFLESLLHVNDPLVIAESLLKLRDMIQGNRSYFLKPITDQLDVLSPVFPYARSYFGSDNPVVVPEIKAFSDFTSEEQQDILAQREQLKCSSEGSLDGQGACALTPEEVLAMDDSYIPTMTSISVDLGYDIASGERFNFVDKLAEEGFEYPKTFDPNCYTLNFFGSDNPRCWWSKGLKDAYGTSYDARFKTPLFSDHILAHMACGISNRVYLTTSDGPKNFVGSEPLFRSENFSAQFTPFNLIKGAPACQTGKYNFAGRFNKTGDTESLHQSFIRIGNKEYYGALNLLIDPTNEWIFPDDIDSIETYWNTNIFPTAKRVAQTLYKEYQEVISRQLIPLFSDESRYIDYQKPVSGSSQINIFEAPKYPQNMNIGYANAAYAYGYEAPDLPKALSRQTLDQFTTTNLRENFVQQARVYLQMAQRLSPLSDEKADELLKTLNEFITAMQRAPVDYTLEGDAFISNMKTQKAYHDNIMERRNAHLNQSFEEAFDGLSAIDWINDQDRSRFMNQISSAHALKEINKVIAARIVEFFVRTKDQVDFEKNQGRHVDTSPEALFGYDSLRVKEALLFYSEDLDQTVDYLKPLFTQFLNNEITAESLFQKLVTDNENSLIQLSFADDADLFKEWLLHRVRSDLFGLLGELKAQYLDEWIHGSKFYLNNLQLEE